MGTGIGVTKEEAKTAASTQTLSDLKKKYYTLRVCNKLVVKIHLLVKS